MPTLDSRKDTISVEKAAIELIDHLALLHSELLQGIRSKQVKEHNKETPGAQLKLFGERGIPQQLSSHDPDLQQIQRQLNSTKDAVQKVVDRSGTIVKGYQKLIQAFTDVKKIIADIQAAISGKLEKVSRPSI